MNFFSSFKKIIGIVLIVAFMAPSVVFVTYPQKAEAVDLVADILNTVAQFGTWAADMATEAQTAISASADSITAVETTITGVATNWWSFVKTVSLDAVAAAIKRMITQKILMMMLSFVRTAIYGNPAFITNPALWFADIGNTTSQVFYADLDRLRMMTDPLSLTNRILDETQRNLEIKASLSYQAAMRPDPMYVFPGGRAGYNAYVMDFNSCQDPNPWNCWFDLQDPANQPFQVQLAQINALQSARAQALDNARRDLAAANGFATVRTCANAIARNNTQYCVQSLAQIPGKVIESQLSSYLQSANASVQNAHDFNEIVAAALVDLSTSWMGGGSLLDATLATTRWPSADPSKSVGAGTGLMGPPTESQTVLQGGSQPINTARTTTSGTFGPPTELQAAIQGGVQPVNTTIPRPGK